MSTDRLTERQEARRQRIIDAAYGLVTEGSYELVQMRDVARLADVAPRTVYHYFSSKDHLVAAAVAQWTSRVHGGDEAIGVGVLLGRSEGQGPALSPGQTTGLS